MKKKTPRLTPGELEIMQILWTHGPVSLAEAQVAIGREIGYTTIQTRLNRLVDKGLLARSAERPAKYRALLRPEEASKPHLDMLLDRIAGGSVVPLVAGLIRNRKLDDDEIASLKALVNELESRGDK